MNTFSMNTFSMNTFSILLFLNGYFFILEGIITEGICFIRKDSISQVFYFLDFAMIYNFNSEKCFFFAPKKKIADDDKYTNLIPFLGFDE